MLGRAEAQVMRLACLYALLDRSFVVRIEHLQAALALWDDCEASTKHIFGSSLGHKDADEIMAALRAAHSTGMTRTEISHGLFNKNKSKLDIDNALRMLLDNKMAYPVIEPRSEGSDVERWFAGTGTT